MSATFIITEGKPMAYNNEQLRDQHFVNGQILEKLENIEKRFNTKDNLCEKRGIELDKIKKFVYTVTGASGIVIFLLIAFKDFLIRYLIGVVK